MPPAKAAKKNYHPVNPMAKDNGTSLLFFAS
jgi:hypothetical protein